MTTPTDAEIREVWEQYNPLHGIESFARAVLAKWGAQPVVPAGYALVPVEPTNAMLDALEEGGCSEGNYKAALAAAPKP